MKILCSISTRGRYDSTLPLAIQSVAMQEVKPDKIVIFDDNDSPVDMRTFPHYLHLFKLLDNNGIQWEVIYGEKKGQHYNHQKANRMGYDLVWRVDDDCVAEPNVLKELYSSMESDSSVGAVGGSVIEPPLMDGEGSGSILELSKPNKQWFRIKEPEEVDHLHCSFLYRAGIVDYNLALSRVAHREETLFTYNLKRAGYRIMVVPCVTWHFRNPLGGIRDGQRELYEHDEAIFRKMLDFKSKLIVLDSGIGDHIIFRSILPEIKERYKNLVIACCYPELFEGENLISIQDAKNLIGNLDSHSIYKFMWDREWKTEMVDAFRELYLKDNSGSTGVKG